MVVPPHFVHPSKALSPENVEALLVLALTPPPALTTVPHLYTGHSSNECCRSCRAPNTDPALCLKSPYIAPGPFRSRPSVRTARRLPPSPPPTWRIPDPPDRATRVLPQIARHECKPAPASAAHNQTLDAPLPSPEPVLSPDHPLLHCCIASLTQPWCTDLWNTTTRPASVPANRLPNTPVVQWMLRHNRCITQPPRIPALLSLSSLESMAIDAVPLPPESQIRS